MAPKAAPPLVGISACVRENNSLPFHMVNQRYLMALSDASATMPVIVPALGDRLDRDALLDRLDGLLVTGSPSNVEPHHYGHQRARDDILHDPARDATTLPLLREAIARRMPIFAICRGIQELNVACGGTLHQFLHEVEGRHDHRSDKSKPVSERGELAHKVDLTPGGVIATLIGRCEVMVNSLHAQAVDRVGDGVRVEATAEDGTVEAVSLVEYPTFGLGVQWHPEALFDRDELSAALFQAFGAATRAYAASRTRSRAVA